MLLFHISAGWNDVDISHIQVVTPTTTLQWLPSVLGRHICKFAIRFITYYFKHHFDWEKGWPISYHNHSTIWLPSILCHNFCKYFVNTFSYYFRHHFDWERGWPMSYHLFAVVQMQTWVDNIISNHIITNHIISNQIISYQIISNLFKSYQIMSDHIKSYHIISMQYQKNF